MPPPLLPHRIIGCSLNSLTSIEGFSYFLFVVIVFILIIQYDFRFLFSSLKKIRGLQRHTLKERLQRHTLLAENRPHDRLRPIRLIFL